MKPEKKLKASRKEIEIKLDLWNDSVDDFQQNQNLFLSFKDLKNRKIWDADPHQPVGQFKELIFLEKILYPNKYIQLSL
jgi:hypothetical protein